MGLIKNLALHGQWARELWCCKRSSNMGGKGKKKCAVTKRCYQEAKRSVTEPEVFISVRDQRRWNLESKMKRQTTVVQK